MNARFCSPGRILPCLFYFSLLYLLLWCWKPARAQGVAVYKPLQIGDTVPDVTIKNILHYKTPTAKLSDFKGKLLILDFWATWCSPCVAMIPRLDSLQKQFEGKVQVLPVSYQSPAEVSRFMDRLARQKGWRIDLPEVAADTVLKRMFPHSYFPHYVWIDQNRTVRAITGSEQVTAENIARFSAANPVSLALKDDANLPLYNKVTTPLLDFLSGVAYKGAATYHAISTPYLKGLAGGYHLENEGEDLASCRITFTNMSPMWLLKVGYGEAKNFFGDSFVSVEVKDPGMLESYAGGQQSQQWYEQNALCYELSVPASQKEEMWQILRQDLQRILPQFQVQVQKRKKMALALVRTSQADKLSSKSTQFSQTHDGLSLTIRKGTLTSFVTNLNVFHMPGSALPLVDRTGYTGEVDMDIEANLSDIKSLNAALARYDISFIEKEVELDILVIKDSPQTKPTDN